AEAKARARLDALGLGQKLNQQAMSLSGGEAQKLALARAMITDPALLFLGFPAGQGHGLLVELLSKPQSVQARPRFGLGLAPPLA
ncbi:MAG: ATP-binding cassette domain-containing protein, partial [Pseudomonadota bacterium]